MTAMFLRSIIPFLVLAAAVAAPAQAAPSLTPLEPCYVVAQVDQRQPITVEAAGFTPFQKVDVFIDDVWQITAPVLLYGDIKGSVLPPFIEEGTRPFTLRLSEVGTPANTLTQTTMVTRLAVEQSPRSASTNQRVRFKGRGFLDKAPVYAHYVFAGKARKSVKLKTPSGPCGTFTVRRDQFPFRKAPARGKWTIQFDQNPYYSATAPVRVPLTVTVRKMPKQASARAR